MKNLNIVAVIPARGGSRAIPKKNIIKFCSKPLIAWSIQQASASKYIKNVYVTSDDKEILKISEGYGAKTILRPKKLATDIASSEDALIHAISHINKIDKKKPDIVVFLQATSPLRTAEDIDEAISLFVKKKADSLFSAAILEDFCVWGYKENKLKSLTYDYKNRGRRQKCDPYYLENGSIYVFKPKVLESYKNRLGGTIALYTMPFWKSYEIDKMEDLEICEYYMKRNIIKLNK